MTTTIILPNDPDLPVELRVRLDWREHNRLLRLAYPLAAMRFEYEVPAGWIARPDDGREVPGHAWVRAERPGSVVAIVNDAKYSYAARDGTLFITVARSPVYAHHLPMRLSRGESYRYIDQGEQGFTLRLMAGRDLSRCDAARAAEALLRPPVATPHVSRGGQAAWRGQWLDARVTTSMVTVLKVSDNGQALVLRAVELEGTADRLELAGQGIEVAPRGIATARLEADVLRASDGLER
jgi:alpha-mannosidase